jgi:hypothetical protein
MEKEYFISKEEFLSAKAKWASSDYHTASNHIIYNALRSKPLDHGFHQKTKNIQGNDAWYAFKEAKRGAWWFARKAPPEAFKLMFGIDRPATLEEMLR